MDSGLAAFAASRNDVAYDPNFKIAELANEVFMPTQGLTRALAARLEDMARGGRIKGKEAVISGVVAGHDGHGPRYAIEGDGDRPFLRMNSNSYLGMALRSEVIEAEEQAAALCGTGPGAVRFISGTWSNHVALEQRLARFHGRSAAILFSSAYAAMMGLIPPLVPEKTAIISDELRSEEHTSELQSLAYLVCRLLLE